MSDPQHFWSAGVDDMLRACWLAGDPVRDIARVFGCSKSAVVNRACRLGLVPHPAGGAGEDVAC
jgi:hypothetical protein